MELPPLLFGTLTVGWMKAFGLKYSPGVRGYRLPLNEGFQLGRIGLRVSPLPGGL